jgi:arylsulfatase A-like enzyme
MRGKTRMLSATLAAGLLPASLILLAGCPGSTVPARGPRPSVLLVTVDSLRTDRLGYAGHTAAATPNLDALASRSLRFRAAQAPAPLTTPALASLLTGRYPMQHGVQRDTRDRLPDGETTLAELLQAAGYRTGAVTGSLLLHPRHGLGQGFAQYLESFGEAPRPREIPVMGFPATRVANKALEWLEGNYREDFFLWVNFHDPHYFYSPPAPFDKNFAENPYDGEVAYVDHELGRLLARLKEYGIDDRTLVIVAGSHGEGLGDHGESYHGTLLHQSTLAVPLLIKPAAAGVSGRDVNVPVSLVDLMPTVLAAAAAAAPDGLDGRSLAAAFDGGAPDVDAERPLIAATSLPRDLFGWEPLVSVRAGRYKYVAASTPRLYDLEQDPGETSNVASAHADIAARLAAEAARVTFQRPECGECAGMVSSLGMSWPATGRQGGAVDPHDRIDVANDALKAHRTFQRKLTDAATLLYRDVLNRDPENHLALVELGWLSGLGQQKEALRPAVDMLTRAQKLYADDGEIYHLLGHMDAASESPDPARALRLFHLAYALDPLNEEALYDAACGEAVAGNAAKALDLLERSIAAGFRDFSHMHKDTDLDSIRGDTRFAQLVPPPQQRPGGKAKAKAAPAS